ncbi:MAG: hypothetical protein AB8W08_00855, partial [Coxiella endosymbiont of Dermacentor silvarum]
MISYKNIKSVLQQRTFTLGSINSAEKYQDSLYVEIKLFFQPISDIIVLQVQIVGPLKAIGFFKT